MVSTTDRVAPRPGLSRLGRIESHARLPFVEPPATKRARAGGLLRWGLAGAVAVAAAGMTWFFTSRVVALAVVEGEALTLEAPAAVLVEEVFATPGAWCEKGAPLVRLAPREPAAGRGVLEAQLNVARMRLELVECGGETQDLLLTRRFDERDRLAAETDSARSDLEAARARYAFARGELDRQNELKRQGHSSLREINEAERDADVAESEVQRALSELEGARLRWARQETLMPAGSGGDDLHERELSLLRELVRECEARLRDFDHQAGARTLVAPISGRVDRVFVQAGSARQQGEPLVSLFDPDSLYALAYISPDDAEDFSAGNRVRLFADGDSGAIPGVVQNAFSAWSAVPPAIQRVYRDRPAALTVRIACDEPERRRLAPHMILRVIAANR